MLVPFTSSPRPNTMKLFIDSHVHVYPSYNIDAFLLALRTRITRTNASCGILFLAERMGLDAFASWAKGENLPPDTSVTRSDSCSLVLRRSGYPAIIIVSGRQIACSERIEILALATRETFQDGIKAQDAISSALASGAVPVLAWGVGKWLFHRSKIVESILKASDPDKLFIGDSSLRPVFWKMPVLLSHAVSLGYKVLAGSDPLPPRYEQVRVGEYADLVESAEIDFSSPLTPQVVSILTGKTLVHTGRRARFFEFLRRMIIK